MLYMHQQSAMAHSASTLIAELVVTGLNLHAGDTGLLAPDV